MNMCNKQGVGKPVPGKQPTLNSRHNRDPFSVTAQDMRKHFGSFSMSMVSDMEYRRDAG